MNSIHKIEITDKDGWRKEFRLSNNIIHIGTDPRNDIVLDREGSDGIAAQHAQLIALPEGFRLINLAEVDVLLGPSGDRSVSPHASAELADGEQIIIGDFTLVLGSGGVGSLAIADAIVSDAIGLSLLLSQTELHPDHPLDGSVMVHNRGNQPGAQFKLEVEGLEPDNYDIGPGPILYPNAEKEVLFRLYHPRRPAPPAGEHRVSFRATAPEAYPGQSAVVAQTLNVLPFYEHQLHLLGPD